MAFGNRVLTTTQTKLVDKLIDGVLTSNVGATRFMGKAKKWSGRQMEFPIKYQKNSTFQTFSGFDTFSTSAVETRVKMTFDPKYAQITVALPLDEVAVNETDEQRLNLLAIEMQSSSQDMADSMGNQFYGNGGGTDFDGLGIMVDDGTTSATYGGLTRATYPTALNSTVTASGGTLTLAKMNTMYMAVSEGMQQPTIIITTKAIFGFYEQLLTPMERINQDVSMVKGGRHFGTGAKTLDYKGRPVLADTKCTTGVMFMLNEDYIDWYALPMPMTKPASFKSQDIEGNDYSEVPGLGFSWSDWIKPTNAAAVVSHVYVGGQFINREPRFNGKLTGITGI